MTTLAENLDRPLEFGNENDLPSIADILYNGSALGVTPATGHLRPLQSGDIFAGFGKEGAQDFSALSAAEECGKMQRFGFVEIPVPGAVITDYNQPVYATDDNLFTFNPVTGTANNVFVGFVKRWVVNGTTVVEFGPHLRDPYALWEKRELLTDDKTLDTEDTGKAFFIATDAKTITVPATATGLQCLIANSAAFGGILLSISPQAADKITAPDIAGTDDKDLLLTKATSRRNDLVEVKSGHADGYLATRMIGTWAEEG